MMGYIHGDASSGNCLWGESKSCICLSTSRVLRVFPDYGSFAFRFDGLSNRGDDDAHTWAKQNHNSDTTPHEFSEIFTNPKA